MIFACHEAQHHHHVHHYQFIHVAVIIVCPLFSGRTSGIRRVVLTCKSIRYKWGRAVQGHLPHFLLQIPVERPVRMAGDGPGCCGGPWPFHVMLYVLWSGVSQLSQEVSVQVLFSPSLGWGKCNLERLGVLSSHRTSVSTGTRILILELWSSGLLPLCDIVNEGTDSEMESKWPW